jgi:hypothetical protein
VFCVVKWRSLRRADRLSRGILPSAMCLSVIGGLSPLRPSSHEKQNRQIKVYEMEIIKFQGCHITKQLRKWHNDFLIS